MRGAAILLAALTAFPAQAGDAPYAHEKGLKARPQFAGQPYVLLLADCAGKMQAHDGFWAGALETYKPEGGPVVERLEARLAADRGWKAGDPPPADVAAARASGLAAEQVAVDADLAKDKAAGKSVGWSYAATGAQTQAACKMLVYDHDDETAYGRHALRAALAKGGAPYEPRQFERLTALAGQPMWTVYARCAGAIARSSGSMASMAGVLVDAGIDPARVQLAWDVAVQSNADSRKLHDAAVATLTTDGVSDQPGADVAWLALEEQSGARPMTSGFDCLRLVERLEP